MDKPKYWVKNAIRKNVQLKVGLKLEITFLTQHHLECRSVDFELENYRPKTDNNLV